MAGWWDLGKNMPGMPRYRFRLVKFTKAAPLQQIGLVTTCRLYGTLSGTIELPRAPLSDDFLKRIERGEWCDINITKASEGVKEKIEREINESFKKFVGQETQSLISKGKFLHYVDSADFVLTVRASGLSSSTEIIESDHEHEFEHIASKFAQGSKENEAVRLKSAGETYKTNINLCVSSSINCNRIDDILIEIIRKLNQ